MSEQLIFPHHQQLDTSKWAVNRIRTFLEYLSDDDRAALITVLQRQMGQPQAIHERKPRKKRNGTEDGAE